MVRTLIAAAGLLAAVAPAFADEKKMEARLFELRIYTAPAGKLDALHARFRDHTVKLFEKHGMANIGYWVPADNKENKLYYVIAHKDKAARAASFKAFGADPDWQAAHKASIKDGEIVGKIESVLRPRRTTRRPSRRAWPRSRACSSCASTPPPRATCRG